MYFQAIYSLRQKEIVYLIFIALKITELFCLLCLNTKLFYVHISTYIYIYANAIVNSHLKALPLGLKEIKYL